MHYACAYGFKECVEVLIKAKSEINALNSWKLSPLNIAMMKNHTHIVRRMLEEEGIDVNCIDDKGRTLLCLAMN
jgi:ankyrin repeat protein